MNVKKRTHRTERLAHLCWGFVLSAACISETLASTASENELRAAVVIGIIRFATQYDHIGQDYPLCVTGSPPSAGKLKQGDGMTILENRKLRVSEWQSGRPLTQCAALVMGPSITPKENAGILVQARATSTILLCDDCKDESQAHATLIRKGPRITFSVDAALAKEAQVSFSSQLLKLADSVQITPAK
jgi:hypothetical protein